MSKKARLFFGIILLAAGLICIPITLNAERTGCLRCFVFNELVNGEYSEVVVDACYAEGQFCGWTQPCYAGSSNECDQYLCELQLPGCSIIIPN